MRRDPAALWQELPALVRRWLGARGAATRDAVLLLPFADLLPLARRAFARDGGWQPRIETARTLAESLGPPATAVPGEPSGDAAIDRLLVARLLQDLPGLDDWRARDPLAFRQAVDDVIEAAAALARAAAQRAPAERMAWWADARAVLQAQAAAAAPLGDALARLALEWAAQAPAPATDRLFDLRPSAWIVLQAGGEDRLTESLLAQGAERGVPALRLQADADAERPFDELPATEPEARVAGDAEAEALAAAAATIDAVSRGQGPVALVAEDRALMRRVRALLERQGANIADESGWTLSTTLPAAQVMTLLRAVHPRAGPDEWLDAIKAESAAADADAVGQLELHWRRGTQPPTPRMQAALEAWQRRLARWQPLAPGRRQPLGRWLASLRGVLSGARNAERWSSDPASRAVWQALRLDTASARADVDGMPMSLDEFTGWVDAVLRDANYIPAVAREQASVIITPMARALLRPFGCVIVPGADDRRLGTPATGPALLPDRVLRALGLDDHDRRARRATLRFAQLLRQPRLLLVRRRAEGDEQLGPSPWWTRLQLARRAGGFDALIERPAELPLQALRAAPVSEPAAVAAAGLPDAVSASAVDALRTCPYRFFARSVLRLSEIEELADDPGKRDYGTLLHAALQRFHEQRAEGADAQAEVERLIALAEQAADELQVEGPAMLPFHAGLRAFAERYLRWLAEREAAGWHHAGAEVAIEVEPPALAGLRLRGRIDRLDANAQGARQVIDYKTGSARSLKDKVAQPLEDTQLAFYAAQLIGQGGAGEDLSAAYLALDERQGILAIPHPDVRASAEALVAGLADEWARLRAGAPMKALGEGAACEYCEARGLCRRDHWSPPEEGAT